MKNEHFLSTRQMPNFYKKNPATFVTIFLQRYEHLRPDTMHKNDHYIRKQKQM